jgi:hypothetical protein
VKDYSALAEKLKGSWQAEIPTAKSEARQGTGLNVLFEDVKAQIIEEAKTANEELRKRRLATIDQVFVPAYRGKLSLSFGTALLCVVDLDANKARITSVIYGPPNREAISKREFLLGTGTAMPQSASDEDIETTSLTSRSGRIASEIVSEILEIGIRVTEKRPEKIEAPNDLRAMMNEHAALAEFWISLGSLLRSYTALHGLNGNRQAAIDQSEQTISVRHGVKWLRLDRNHAVVTWMRENGRSGLMELTRHGHFLGPEGEQAMDLAAESWARELMHDNATEPGR